MGLGEKWKRPGTSCPPASSVEVMRALGAIGVYSTGQQFAWRGVSSLDYAMSRLCSVICGFKVSR